MTRGVRRPGDAVDTSTVVIQPCHGGAGHTHVQDDDLKRGFEQTFEARSQGFSKKNGGGGDRGGVLTSMPSMAIVAK